MEAEAALTSCRIGSGGRTVSWRACVCAVAVALMGAATGARATDFVFRVPKVLVDHAAADRTIGSEGAERSPAPSTPSTTTSQVQTKKRLNAELYEEYFVEHSISTVDARQAAKEVDVEELGVDGCGTCGRRERAYCEMKVLADHCCCERRYLREPLPWVPHTCYVGPRPCRPLAGNCARYARIRDCCCIKGLAERWRSVLLSGRAEVPTSTSELLLATALAMLATR